MVLLRGAAGAALVLFFSAGGTSAGGPPHPMSAATRADLECLVAIMESGNAMEKIHPGSTQTAAMYYFGRLDGDDPKLDLEAAMRWQLSQMSAKDTARADFRCGGELTRRGAYLQTIGRHMMTKP